jgi:GNAT superfamily N-acetyltransferase
MSISTEFVLRDVAPADHEQWSDLYRAYRRFYKLVEDDAVVATTWGWVSGREHGIRGIVAANSEGRLIALANLRSFARPSTATLGLYLDDLFTDPISRGSGVATALLARASEIAAEGGANIVRWITAADNAVARNVYDAHATATPWITYDMKPSRAASSF